jgi:S-adenosylmethionine:tRNA ribosyltransferase-isomerase
MTGDSYTFDLPPELVAQDPPARRGQSRLLVIDRGGVVDGVRAFMDLPSLLRRGDLLVVNDSRVLPARLLTVREDTGGRVELLLLAPDAARPGAWRALARPVRRLRPGQVLAVTRAADGEAAGPRLDIVDVGAGGEVGVRVAGGEDPAAVAEAHGEVPLPPYIRRDPAADSLERRRNDRQRYQTVYARADEAGASVAAPTAGLHFDDAVLAALDAAGVGIARVTLHVGPGTFRNPTPEQIATGRLHGEAFRMAAGTWRAWRRCRDAGGRVIAVGTTSLRVLETVARLALPDPTPDRVVDAAADPDDATPPVFTGRAAAARDGWEVAGTTRLFIQPPDAVTAADGLLTNFHLPGSSLLRLVASFTGEDSWRAAYRRAVAERLRFFSYGDAMFIRPARPGDPS